MKRWERSLFRRKKAGAAETEHAAEAGKIAVPVPEAENWQERYESEHAAYETFRSEQETAALRQRREAAYRTLLSECGIPQAKHDTILRLSDVDGVQLDENGAAADADALRGAIRKEWGALIPPLFREQNPVLRGTSVTKADILAIRDRNARRSAIAENIELFR